MIKKIYFICLMTMLCSCATSQKYALKLDQDIGKTEQQILNEWGTPQEIQTKANGLKEITYVYKSEQVLPITNYSYINEYMDEDEMFDAFTYGGNEIPDGNFLGETIQEKCFTTFYLKNNTVISYKFKGNACVSI